MRKLQVYHFYNGKGGGVLSVIQNLLKYSNEPGIENHVIYTINKEEDPSFKMLSMAGAVSEQLFLYSPKWNFYYTAKALSGLLPGKNAVVVAHDWVELGMVSNLGLQNPVVYILHGNYNYYYELASIHQNAIDTFICVSPKIYETLCIQIPVRKPAIHYCRFPVPVVPQNHQVANILRLFFCVRDLTDENKQFYMLPIINSILVSKGITVQWTIVGKNMDHGEILDKMGKGTQLTLYPSLPNEKVINLLPEQDIFLLPSLKEGFPVTVVEAMKAGLVPLITNWDNATVELVMPGHTGYYLKAGDAEAYAACIAALHTDRKLLYRLSVNCVEKANQLFDPIKNTEAYNKLFIESVEHKTVKNPVKIYGSRLDQKWIPNSFVHLVRYFMKESA